MKNKFLLLVCLVMTSISAQAKILYLDGPFAPSVENVKISKVANLQLETSKTTVNLIQVANGLRKKKVAFVWFKVYVGQIFSSTEKPIDYTTLQTLQTTLSQNNFIAVSLTFLRHVTEKQIKNAFQEQLEANAIDLKSKSVQDFLAAVEKAGSNDEGKTLSVIFNRSTDGSESLFVENGSGATQKVSLEKDMIAKMLTIWFGKTSDSGMIELQSQLMKKPN